MKKKGIISRYKSLYYKTDNEHIKQITDITADRNGFIFSLSEEIIKFISKHYHVENYPEKRNNQIRIVHRRYQIPNIFYQAESMYRYCYDRIHTMNAILPKWMMHHDEMYNPDPVVDQSYLVN